VCVSHSTCHALRSSSVPNHFTVVMCGVYKINMFMK